MRKLPLSVRILTLTLLSGIGAVIIVLWVSITPGNLSIKAEQEKWTLPTGTFHTASTVPTPQIPSYPNAQDLQPIADADPFVRRFSYTTLDTRDIVMEFYRHNLQSQGWELLSSSMWYASYEWKDQTGTVPYGLFLHVGLTNWYGNRVFAEIDLEHWPEADRTPLYPTAKQIEYSQQQEHTGEVTRIIIFVVKAPQNDVEAYYKSRLTEYGWKFEMEESEPHNLVFRSLYRVGRRVSVDTHTNRQNETKIYLSFEEGELPSNP
jgi:hypothetical protein